MHKLNFQRFPISIAPSRGMLPLWVGYPNFAQFRICADETPNASATSVIVLSYPSI